MFGPPFGLEQVFTHLPVSVWTTDADLRLTYVADGAKALGLREGDVVAKTSINSFGQPPQPCNSGCLRERQAR